jgi:Glycosyl hydrolase family 26
MLCCVALRTESGPTRRRGRGGRIQLACLAAVGVSAMMLVACAMAKPGHGRKEKHCRTCASQRHVLLWGAWLADPEPWRRSRISAFEHLVGKGLSLVEFGVPFANCAQPRCTYYRFPRAAMDGIRAAGAIPVLSWSSESIPATVNEPQFRLADVLSGRYDGLIRRFAAAARRWGHPFFLRYDWEMNGNWFAWSERANGNHRGQFVAAWRHVHQIFTEEGATNATWVWCPNINLRQPLSALTRVYPGDAYVDWTCVDGYNHGHTGAGSGPWLGFDRLYRKTYQMIVRHVAPSKPMLIGEVASTVYGGSKAAWITSMLRELPRRFPQIHGLLWLEQDNPPWHWVVNSSPAAAQAFSSGIKTPTYLGNVFCHLGGSLIGLLSLAQRTSCH